MITGTTLRGRGWPQGRITGLAIGTFSPRIVRMADEPGDI